MGATAVYAPDTTSWEGQVDTRRNVLLPTRRREGTPLLGYGAPLVATTLAAWAFFGPGRFDPTELRLALEIFGTAAALGAVLPNRDLHVGLLAFAATGFALTGLASLATVGPLTWFAGALCVVAIVDAAHAADREGSGLGRAPLVGTAVAGVLVAMVNILL